MVGADLKAETMALMEKRSAVEVEMNSIIQRLCRPGGPGFTGNLLDEEGFPRADIDIAVVRADRRRLAELKNDHREITDKITANMHVLHSFRPNSRVITAKDSGNEEAAEELASVSVTPQSVVGSKPFAMIDEISESSPAAEDGLQLGDQIVKFGNVEAGDNLLQRLATEAQSNQGQAVAVVLIRQGAFTNISVTPRIWQGRGLLGCHFRML